MTDISREWTPPCFLSEDPLSVYFGFKSISTSQSRIQIYLKPNRRPSVWQAIPLMKDWSKALNISWQGLSYTFQYKMHSCWIYVLIFCVFCVSYLTNRGRTKEHDPMILSFAVSLSDSSRRQQNEPTFFQQLLFVHVNALYCLLKYKFKHQTAQSITKMYYKL